SCAGSTPSNSACRRPADGYARPDRARRGKSVDPTYSAEAEEYREKIRAFLAEHLPPGWKGVTGLPPDQRGPWLDEWRATLANAGLLAVAWPKDYGGGGLTALEQVVLAEEFAKA